MAKIKIEIEIDVDFQKFFDEIPEELNIENDFADGVEDWYSLEVVHKVLRESHTSRLMNQMDWMAKRPNDYKYAEHHLKIDVEVARQINENAKVTIIK